MNRKALHSFFKQGLTQLGYEIVPDKTTVLLDFIDHVQKWNRVHNLTRIVEPREMVIKHLLDSLTLGPLLHGTRILDVGSGAGLPGLPLAVYYPECHFILLDSSAKRTQFLTQMVHRLELPNVAIIHARLQDFIPDLPFSTVVSRAFSELALFAELSNPLMDASGVLIAMKGQCDEAELAALPQSYSQRIVKLSVPYLKAQRHAIVLSKKG